jgi:hypothetical protein
LAIAADMDSPFAVTRAESAVIGIIRSRDCGLEMSFFQGPGESPDMRGEGKGVTSAIALNIGDERAELGADPRLELLPKLPAKTFFILGVRANGTLIDCDFCDALVESGGVRAVLLLLAAVTVYPGMISV